MKCNKENEIDYVKDICNGVELCLMLPTREVVDHPIMKIVGQSGDMSYNVFGGMLNLAQLNLTWT